jgi:hypothetical protein
LLSAFPARARSTTRRIRVRPAGCLRRSAACDGRLPATVGCLRRPAACDGRLPDGRPGPTLDRVGVSRAKQVVALRVVASERGHHLELMGSLDTLDRDLDT